MQCGSDVAVLDGTGHGTLYIGGTENTGTENAGLENKLESNELRIKQMIRHTRSKRLPELLCY